MKIKNLQTYLILSKEYLSCFLFLLLFFNISHGQILNNEFEIWELYNGKEKPTEWDCPNLNSNIGPCEKNKNIENNTAVSIHNVMPCVSSNNQASSRAAGFIKTKFLVDYAKFKISYDLNIEEIEAPAVFIFELKGESNDGSVKEIFTWEHNELISERIEHDIELLEFFSELTIEFRSEGFEKTDALHECDLGYLRAVIDNVEIAQTVSNKAINYKKYKIYPNPTSDFISFENIEVFDNFTIKIFNQIGQLLQEQKMDTSIIDLRKYIQGIYYLNIQNEEGTILHSEKIIKI